MTAAELWLLVVLASKLISDGIQQLHITLLRVLVERSDESITHGASGLSGDGGVGTRLRVLAAAPHDNVRGAGLGLLNALVRALAGGGFLEEAHGCAGETTEVATSIGRNHS